jgi:hypothetical protein
MDTRDLHPPTLADEAFALVMARRSMPVLELSRLLDTDVQQTRAAIAALEARGVVIWLPGEGATPFLGTACLSADGFQVLSKSLGSPWKAMGTFALMIVGLGFWHHFF